ncbi:MAG TPA: substrate-binding domain-containing protein [Acidobacteriota bacterium]|nr:substrate-binding domain-containing protein [Acidobacteriota bacterium]
MGCSLRLVRMSVLGSIVLLAACAQEPRQVTVCHDASLSAFIQSASERFQSNHPGIRVASRSQGSLQALRQMEEGDCDLMATADWRLIERFMIPQRARRGTVFLGDEMVLATAQPGELDTAEKQTRWKEEWPRLIFSESRSYGIADPDRSPAGYFAHLAWKLAEIHYRNPGLYRRFLNHFDQRWMRPQTSDLAASLEAGDLDFAFLYQSTAAQKGWNYVRFPSPVSLGESSQSDRYRQVFLEVEGVGDGRPFKVDGAPIRYGICALEGAVPESEVLLEYLLSPQAADMAKRLGYASVPQKNIGAGNPE